MLLDVIVITPFFRRRSSESSGATPIQGQRRNPRCGGKSVMRQLPWVGPVKVTICDWYR